MTSRSATSRSSRGVAVRAPGDRPCRALQCKCLLGLHLQNPDSRYGSNTCWESSGIVDASAWFGAGPWLFDVQAHSRPEPRLGIGIDRTHIRELLRLTPTERARLAAANVANIAEFERRRG